MTTRARLLLASLALLLPLALVPTLPARAAGDWLWPVVGEVLKTYRNGDDPYAGGQHRGIDVAASPGAPVVAAAAGTVRHAGVAGSSGLTVSVRTADGRYDTSYLHLSEADVSEGEEVAAGQRLGSVGVTGRRSSAAPHLHFGVRTAASRHAYVDPLALLGPRVAPPGEAPKPAPVPVEAPVPVAPAPAPVPAPRTAPAPRSAPRTAPAPRPGPRTAPAPRPVGAPEAAPRPVPAPQPRRVPLGRPASKPRGAPVPSPGFVPAPAARFGSAPAVGPAAPRQPAEADRPAAPRQTTLRAEPPARAPVEEARSGGEGSSSGPDIGWALACAGLLLAAACLGRPGDRGRRAGASAPGRDAPAALRALVRPLLGRR